MQLHQYRIDYKWREPSQGQRFRVWQKSFMIVKAASSLDAEKAFVRSWTGNNEFQIISTEKVGV